MQRNAQKLPQAAVCKRRRRLRPRLTWRRRRGARSEAAAANQHDAIKAFVQGTIAEAAPVVPISAQLKYNIDAVCEYIVKKARAPCPRLARAPRRSDRHAARGRGCYAAPVRERWPGHAVQRAGCLNDRVWC